MKYIIHRGIVSNEIDENTYGSIKRALRNYSSYGVELDVRLTKDRKIVLSHNSLIDFNTIENMNYLDIIKRKYLTTLDKILDISTDKVLLIDIKTNNNYKIFGDTLIKYLSNSKRNIYLCSFDKKIINYLKNKVPYKLGYISFIYKKVNTDFIMVNYNGVSNKKLLKALNKDVFLWTITNEKELVQIKEKFSNVDDYFLIIDKEE